MNIHRVKPFEYSFTCEEANDANDRWGANCGPGALAAMLGVKLDDVRAHLPKFDDRHYTNPTMMQAALRSLGVSYHDVDDGDDRVAVEHGHAPFLRFPDYGIMRIQWEGPWMNPGVPVAARYKYTHWIGVIQGDQKVPGVWFFDINGGWFDPAKWAIEVVKPITSEIKRATGIWHPTHRWELDLK